MRFLPLALALWLAWPSPVSADPALHRLPQRITASPSVLHPSLHGAVGSQSVIVRLTHEALAAFEASEQPGMAQAVEAEQIQFVQRCRGLAGFRVIARVSKVLNAVFVQVDASALAQLAQDPAVTRIAPVTNYELDLSEVVPYVGSSKVSQLGFDGTGVSIAILDSGIDYTHRNLGGPGTVAAYEEAYGTGTDDPRNLTLDGLFPTAKVVGGFDFVGEVWPNGDLAPDPDPIDFEGHGTHVADIAAGLGGMAPGAKLHAVKVCSAVSSSCSGVALIQGMEYAVDPNGDGDTRDHVDIINMSLGANYGTAFDDDLSAAVDNATRIGVLTVSSAGNGSDKPYITGTPSSAPTAIAVAQTAVPSATLDVMEITAPAPSAGLYLAVFQPWSQPLTSVIAGPVTYGDGNGGNLLGCAPFTTPLSGIVVVDRGACNFSLKVQNIEAAGGSLAIIAQNTGDPPFPGGFGGGPNPTIPGFMISRADGLLIKAPGATVSFDPANGIPLIGSTVVSSSRGPAMGSNLLKPEIGAPGASVSAVAGTGTGETAFGGTSGASPVIAGIAAQLLEARRFDLRGVLPGRAGLPLALKALLVTSAERITLDSDIGLSGGSLAPVSRIGGGEVRATDALFAPIVITEKRSKSPVLSFGHVNVTKPTTLKKTLVVANTTSLTLTYLIKPEFRFTDDELSRAVAPSAPKSVVLGPFQKKEIEVTLYIESSKLPENAMSSGSGGNVGSNLTATEYDGYVVFDGPSYQVVPWHIIPMKSADARAPATLKVADDEVREIRIRNGGEGTAQLADFALLAVSPDIPEGPVGGQAPTPDIRAFGYRTIDAGCDAGFGFAFLVNTWEPQTHLVPVSHQIEFDLDRDGTTDYILLNRDFTFNNVTDGRQLSWVFTSSTGDAGAFFFAEHATNTGNTVLLACGEQFGLTASDFQTRLIDIILTATDFYFGGPGDSVGPFTIVAGGDQFVADDGAGGPIADIAGNSIGRITINNLGHFPGTTAELGLLVQTNADRGTAGRGASTLRSEALTILVSP